MSTSESTETIEEAPMCFKDRAFRGHLESCMSCRQWQPKMCMQDRSCTSRGMHRQLAAHVLQVLDGALAGCDGLDEEAKHGEHGQTAVLDLLDLHGRERKLMNRVARHAWMDVSPGRNTTTWGVSACLLAIKCVVHDGAATELHPGMCDGMPAVPLEASGHQLRWTARLQCAHRGCLTFSSAKLSGSSARPRGSKYLWPGKVLTAGLQHRLHSRHAAQGALHPCTNGIQEEAHFPNSTVSTCSLMCPDGSSWGIQYAGTRQVEAAVRCGAGVYSLAPRVQLVQARAALDAALVPVALNGTHEDDLQRSDGLGSGDRVSVQGNRREQGSRGVGPGQWGCGCRAAEAALQSRAGAHTCSKAGKDVLARPRLAEVNPEPTVQAAAWMRRLTGGRAAAACSPHLCQQGSHDAPCIDQAGNTQVLDA